MCTQVILEDACAIFKGEVYDISDNKTVFAMASQTVVGVVVIAMIGGGGTPRTGQ